MLALLGVKPTPSGEHALRKGAAAKAGNKSRAAIAPGSPWQVTEPHTAYGSAGRPVGGALESLATDPFKMAAVETLATKLRVAAEDLITLLGIAGRTAQRRWQEGELTLDESDKLYRIARIFHRAVEVLGAEEGASLWLSRPQAFFSGAAPLALLGSDAGAKAVEDQLGRIDHGIFA